MVHVFDVVLMVLVSILCVLGQRTGPETSCDATSATGCAAALGESGADPDVVRMLQGSVFIGGQVARPEDRARDLPLFPDDRQNGQTVFIDRSLQSEVKTVERVLDMAAAEGDKAAKAADKVLVSSSDPGALIRDPKSQVNHEIMVAIEEVSVAESVEDAVEDGVVVTSNLLQDVQGLSGTPEDAARQDVLQGDMVGSGDMLALLQQAIADGQRFVPNLWSNSKAIKYCFSPNIASSSKKAFEDAVQHFKDLVPCLGFMQISPNDEDSGCVEKPSYFITSNQPGCWSNVGQLSQWQQGKLNLQVNGCDTMGVAAHELGHMVGMLHEQSRQDHQSYVKILWDNIQPEKKDQYKLEDNADQTVPYDVMSLMHYGDTFFALPGKKTMEYVKQTKRLMGNRMGLTNADVLQLAKMYKCEGEQGSFKLCTEDPNACETEDCVCHQGSGLIKTVDGGCNRCQKQCPNAPAGAGSCGCPIGCTKGSFTQQGNIYSYCNAECTQQGPVPTARRRRTRRRTPAATPPPQVKLAPGSCVDKNSMCGQFKQYCGYNPLTVTTGDGQVMVNLTPGGDCDKTCAMCPGDCFDAKKPACEQYGNQYCDKPVTLSGQLYKEVCKKTCGIC